MYTIMIVEDEPLERKALNLILSRDYKGKLGLLDDARNGKEAIVKACQNKPDIILMDIGLPEMNGINAQKEIMQHLPEVQTIIITAYSDFNFVQNALQARVVDYLLKPVDTLDLRESLNKVLAVLDEKKIKKEGGRQVVEDKDLIATAISYIKQHYREDILLGTLAEHVHLNPQYFSRLFKKKVGMSYIEYINSLKVEYAKEMLHNSNYPIYRIAAEAGFADSAYFNRVFCKYAGHKPSDFRKHRLG